MSFVHIQATTKFDLLPLWVLLGESAMPQVNDRLLVIRLLPAGCGNIKNRRGADRSFAGSKPNSIILRSLRTPATASVVGHGREAVSLLLAGPSFDGRTLATVLIDFQGSHSRTAHQLAPGGPLGVHSCPFSASEAIADRRGADRCATANPPRSATVNQRISNHRRKTWIWRCD